MAITAQVIDDRNPAVVYSPGWILGGSSNEFNETTTYTCEPSLMATLIFRGTQVFVFGTVHAFDPGRLPPQSSYIVDSSSPVFYEAVPLNQTLQYSTRFYASPLLANGQHTLIVINLLKSQPFLLDYFLILRADNSTSSSQVVPVASISSSQTSPANFTSEAKSLSNSSTGTAVGSAFGAAGLVIFAVAIMLLFWFRRDRNIQTPDGPINNFAEPPTTTDVPTPSESEYGPQNPLALRDPHRPLLPTPPGYPPSFSALRHGS